MRRSVRPADSSKTNDIARGTVERMSIDIDRAASFLAAHAPVLDRRRFALLTEEATDRNRRAVLAALEGYRNADGGYGWGIEPDLRAPESQPAGALHVLEVIAEAGPVTTPATLELLDWADSVTLPDGGLPFALPMADPGASSLQITAVAAAQAHRAGRFDTEVREHPWTVRATRYCLGEISRTEEVPFAYVLSFALGFWTPPPTPTPRHASNGGAWHGSSPPMGRSRSREAPRARRSTYWTWCPSPRTRYASFSMTPPSPVTWTDWSGAGVPTGAGWSTSVVIPRPRPWNGAGVRPSRRWPFFEPTADGARGHLGAHPGSGVVGSGRGS